MKDEDDWAKMVKGILKAEMKRRGVTYDELARRLSETGTEFTPVNLRNKVSRGTFAASFFVQCLAALDVKRIELE